MILVTGATGLVGAHLLLKLVQRNEKIRAIYRSEHKLKQVKRIFSYYVENPDVVFADIDFMQCDITDVVTLEKAFDSVSKVYHCAAYISFDPNHFKKLQKTNVEGTANIVNFCVEKNIEKLCYVSSIAAIGADPKKEQITEDLEFNPTDANVYALTKNAAELEVWRGTQEGASAVVVNPGVILGPGQWKSGSGAFFSQNAKTKRYFLPSGTGFISIADVVDTMLGLMESDIVNERYILVAENLSFAAVQAKIAKAFNLPAATKSIKLWQLQLFWRFDWLRSKITGSRRILSKSMAKSFETFDTYSSEKIEKDLGIKLKPLDKIIEFCCAIYQKENQ